MPSTPAPTRDPDSEDRDLNEAGEAVKAAWIFLAREANTNRTRGSRSVWPAYRESPVKLADPLKLT